jgi:hypothetical protein
MEKNGFSLSLEDHHEIRISRWFSKSENPLFSTSSKVKSSLTSALHSSRLTLQGGVRAVELGKRVRAQGTSHTEAQRSQGHRENKPLRLCGLCVSVCLI